MSNCGSSPQLDIGPGGKGMPIENMEGLRTGTMQLMFEIIAGSGLEQKLRGNGLLEKMLGAEGTDGTFILCIVRTR